jgi:hypothetical protein
MKRESLSKNPDSRISKTNLQIESNSLGKLLTETKDILIEKGIKSESQKGATYSLNNVLLSWENPKTDNTRYTFWSKKANDWYQRVFVRKESAKLPEELPESGDLLFPYTYAQRGRLYDGSWGLGLAVVNAARKLKTDLNKVCMDRKSVNSWLGKMGEMVHIQNVMAVLIWWKKDIFNFWLKNYRTLEILVENTRFDPLEKISEEIRLAPLTRRAITPSLVYSIDYMLTPMIGIPPYQNFQLLPSEKDSPLSSLHWHRSLDASGGAQLDFNHDLEWLSFACRKTRRRMGTISILVGNLHLYVSSEGKKEESILANESIEDRLNMWTDGYRSGKGVVKDLLQKDAYQKNLNRVYSSLEI